MRYLILILVCIFPIAGFAQSPVSVRIKNNSKLLISKIELTNSHGEESVFNNIKAGKTSSYKKLNSFCACGYQMKIWYYKNARMKPVATANCMNVMECKDFFQGKLMIKINSKFTGNEAEAELTFKKE